jgi:hypothetical protein
LEKVSIVVDKDAKMTVKVSLNKEIPVVEDINGA